MGLTGQVFSDGRGTSFATAYVSGVFAVACQRFAPICDSATSAAPLYNTMKEISPHGTVVKPNGSPLDYPTTSRFISKQW